MTAVRNELMSVWAQPPTPFTGRVTASTAPPATETLPAVAKPGRAPLFVAVRMPPLTVVPPLYALFVLPSTNVPLPFLTTAPRPLMPPVGEMVRVSVWLNASTAPPLTLMTVLPRASLLPPLPICSVPALTVVGPTYVLEPEITINPGPSLSNVMPE